MKGRVFVELATLHRHLPLVTPLALGAEAELAEYVGWRVGAIIVGYFYKDVPMTGYEQATRRVEWHVDKILTVPKDAAQSICLMNEGCTVEQVLEVARGDISHIVILSRNKNVRMNDNFLLCEWEAATVLPVV